VQQQVAVRGVKKGKQYLKNTKLTKDGWMRERECGV
jgi:hypothetical protein